MFLVFWHFCYGLRWNNFTKPCRESHRISSWRQDLFMNHFPWKLFDAVLMGKDGFSCFCLANEDRLPGRYVTISISHKKVFWAAAYFIFYFWKHLWDVCFRLSIPETCLKKKCHWLLHTLSLVQLMNINDVWQFISVGELIDIFGREMSTKNFVDFSRNLRVGWWWW